MREAKERPGAFFSDPCLDDLRHLFRAAGRARVNRAVRAVVLALFEKRADAEIARGHPRAYEDAASYLAEMRGRSAIPVVCVLPWIYDRPAQAKQRWSWRTSGRTTEKETNR